MHLLRITYLNNIIASNLACSELKIETLEQVYLEHANIDWNLNSKRNTWFKKDYKTAIAEHLSVRGSLTKIKIQKSEGFEENGQ